mgnify:CR=1 FL=1
MRNFISEDDIERAILSKLKEAPFEYETFYEIKEDNEVFLLTHLSSQSHQSYHALKGILLSGSPLEASDQ